ncbi:MAG: TraX family protein [Clostridiaceae bacterium]
MNNTQLKILACFIMLIDHIGAIFFPDYFILRLIGRLAFPIFAYLIAMGYTYTHNIKNYFRRLILFALISQIPFYLAFKNEIGNSLYLNIFFTLFLGLLSLYFYDKLDNNIKYLSPFIFGLIAEFISTDYGLFGVLTIFLFYLFKDNFKKLVFSQIILNILNSLSYVFIILSENYNISIFSVQVWNECFSLFALFFIFIYNKKKGKGLKYIFYIFYPLHLLILFLIEKLII